MNILILGTHFQTGGITSYCLTLAKELVEQGHTVVVVSQGGNCVDALTNSGAVHIRMNIRTKSIMHPKIYMALPRLKRIVAQYKIDVIHGQTRVTQVLGACLARITAKPLVTTCHGFFKPKLSRKVFPCWGDRVIAISRAVRMHLVTDLHAEAEAVRLVSNGVDVDQFKSVTADKREELKHQWNLSHNPVIGIIARLSNVKGHQYLIQAMPILIKKYPTLMCLIVGEGPLEKELKRRVLRHDLEDNVLFYKVINQTVNMLPIFDVFVMPSLQEGLGLSALEAQAAALPVVASRVGGLPDIIVDGETGFLVEPRNAEALAAAVLKLLDDPHMATRVGRQAQVFIEKNHSAEMMAHQTMAVYEEAVKCCQERNG